MKIDRKFVILAVVLFYLLVIRLAIAPNWQSAGKLKKETADLSKSLSSLTTLNAGYLSERRGLEAALRREGSTGILSAAQNKAQEMGIAAKLKSVTPIVRDLNAAFRLEGYDLRLEEVSLKEAILFSESMQKEDGFYLDRIVLEKSKDGMSLSARLRILTIRKL
ncbi:MAG: hypothetical protein ABIK20_04765 [Candidatus Omnitrophota bacterium]|nr:hypothetical protein [Candidatus Omnitrophota bacterium]